ncbi:MAG: alpha/beta hydrolase [Chloroflexota bacterium]|nr:alpha/beta hydrolase [Chloroflexota bacterium]
MSFPNSVEHTVQIPYAQGVLRGLLAIPTPPGHHPAVVLLPGSGAADRNVSYLRPVRDHLVRHGIAALVFDKPGLGGSSGDWRHQTFYDRAQQARAAIKFLQRRTDIHPKQIGLYGISQGAWITLLASATYKDIPFIIPVSGPAMRPVDQDLYYIEHMMRADGYAETQIQQAVQYVKNVLNAAYQDASYAEVTAQFIHSVHNEPWYHYYAIPDADMWEYFRRNAKLHYNPLEWLEQVKCPVLAIFGASDLLLPVEESVTVFKHALAKAGNRDVTIKVFANAGHLVTYPSTEKLAPGFLELITDWLKQRVQTSQTPH